MSLCKGQEITVPQSVEQITENMFHIPENNSDKTYDWVCSLILNFALRMKNTLGDMLPPSGDSYKDNV